MTAIAQEYWEEQADDPEVRIDGRVDPAREDAYWQSVFWGEPYYRADLCYDDYAPAYCVGYIGFGQYGGRFDDAEKSLSANWLRIKGDSRLSYDEAMQAIRAAWQHASASVDEEADAAVGAGSFGAGRRTAEPAYATA